MTWQCPWEVGTAWMCSEGASGGCLSGMEKMTPRGSWIVLVFVGWLAATISRPGLVLPSLAISTCHAGPDFL